MRKRRRQLIGFQPALCSQRNPSGTGSEQTEKPDHLFEVTLNLQPGQKATCGFGIRIRNTRHHEISR